MLFLFFVYLYLPLCHYSLYLSVEINNDMAKLNVILTVVVGLLFSSCVSFGYVTFERLEAGSVNYPESVRKVGVVNNMPYFDLARLDKKVLDMPHLEGDGTIAADTLAHLLASAEYFDDVVICDDMLQGMEASFSEPYSLSKMRVDSLMEEMGVDVLFSLDRIKIDLAPWYASSGWNGSQYRGVKVIVTPVLFAYVPGRDGAWFAISHQDSIGFNWNEPMSLGKFQKDASSYSAYMLMEYLLPSWKMVERPFYASGCVEMRDANVYMMSENWSDAFRLWKQAYETKNGKKKMMAAYNLAIYYEVHDDTERALEYLEEAMSLVKSGSYDAGMMNFYRMQLKNRIEKRQKLDMQMRRFE